jgi:hypothetical protein
MAPLLGDFGIRMDDFWDVKRVLLGKMYYFGAIAGKNGLI